MTRITLQKEKQNQSHSSSFNKSMSNDENEKKTICKMDFRKKTELKQGK
jgi:hypothetical protein